jgi:hypothetical protein
MLFMQFMRFKNFYALYAPGTLLMSVTFRVEPHCRPGLPAGIHLEGWVMLYNMLYNRVGVISHLRLYNMLYNTLLYNTSI